MAKKKAKKKCFGLEPILLGALSIRVESFVSTGNRTRVCRVQLVKQRLCTKQRLSEASGPSCTNPFLFQGSEMLGMHFLSLYTRIAHSREIGEREIFFFFVAEAPPPPATQDEEVTLPSSPRVQIRSWGDPDPRRTESRSRDVDDTSGRDVARRGYDNQNTDDRDNRRRR